MGTPYWVTPNGEETTFPSNNDGLSSGSPVTIADLVSSLVPGDTVNMKGTSMADSGLYDADEDSLDFSGSGHGVNIAGTDSERITFTAVNPGSVVVKASWPLRCSGEDDLRHAYMTFEGMNLWATGNNPACSFTGSDPRRRDQTPVIPGSGDNDALELDNWGAHHCILRLSCAYGRDFTEDIDACFSAVFTNDCLFEDVFGFGTFNKIFGGTERNRITYRRVWGYGNAKDDEAPDAAGQGGPMRIPSLCDLSKRSINNLAENMILSWGHYTRNVGTLRTGEHHDFMEATQYRWPGDTIWAGALAKFPNTDHRLRGMIMMLPAEANPEELVNGGGTPGNEGVIRWGGGAAAGGTWQDTAVFIDPKWTTPGEIDGNDYPQRMLLTGDTTCADSNNANVPGGCPVVSMNQLRIDDTTLIGGDPAKDRVTSDWAETNTVEGVQGDGEVWLDNANGAYILKRYVDGTRTGDDWFPWTEMSQRILDWGDFLRETPNDVPHLPTHAQMDIETIVQSAFGNYPSVTVTNTLPSPPTVESQLQTALPGFSVASTSGLLDSVQITVDRGTSTLTLSGAATVSAGTLASSSYTLAGTVTDLNASLATLSYTSALLDTSANLTMLSIVGAASDNDVLAITITVPSVNNPPVITAVLVLTVSTVVATAVTGVSATDADNDLASVAFAVTNGTVAVTASGSAIVTGNGTAALNVSGTEADINATIATLIFTSAATVNTATITITATDAELLEDVEVINITIPIPSASALGAGALIGATE